MFSITPSKLETFRKYIDGEWNEYFTKEMVIDQIRGTQKSSFQANFGTAVHEILEKGYQRYFNEKVGLYIVKVQVKGQSDQYFDFNPVELAPVMEYVDTHTSAVNEIPLKFKIIVNGVEVILSMKIDEMFGVGAGDHKTSDKEPKLDEYERSAQWKIYTLATEAKFFKYNHFQCRRLDRGKGDIEIILREFVFYPYPKMEEDIIKLIQRFIMFCENEDLMSYIQYKEPGGVV